jgi:glutathione S-transferase
VLTLAAAGTIYLAGRAAYAIGYSTGDPKKRQWGGFQYIGLLTLLGLTIQLGANLISS